MKNFVSYWEFKLAKFGHIDSKILELDEKKEKTAQNVGVLFHLDFFIC